MPKTIQLQINNLLKSLLTIILVSLAVFATPSYSRGYAPVILTLAIIGLLFMMGVGKKSQPVNLVDISVLGLILVLGITAIPSIEPHRSWIWVVGIGGGLIVMVASREAVRRWFSANKILAGVLATGFVFQVVLTSEVARWYFDWRNQFPEFIIPPQTYRFANGNSWAAYLIPLIFLQMGIFFTNKNILTRWLTTVSMAWTFVLVFFCSSRGGMIGLGAAGLTFVIAEWKIIWEWLRPAWDLLTRRRWITVGVGLAVLIGIGAAAWVVFQAFESHPTHGSFGFDSRLPFWKPSWDAFLNSPLWGNGFFTEANFYMETTSIPPAGLYFHSHNLYLDIFEGSGLLGGTAAGFFIVTLTKGLRRARRNTPSSALPISMAAFPILAGFLVHSLFDSLYWESMVSIPLAIIFGSVLAYDDQRVNFKLPVAQIAAILILAGAWGLYYVQWPFLQAVNENVKMDWQVTATGLDEAVNRFPISPIFNLEAGLAHAELAEAGNTKELRKAIEYTKAAVENDPNFALNWLNLGALQRESGDLDNARDSIETAVNKANRWGLAWVNLGEVCEASGDTACAQNAYMKALELHPSWATDPFWYETDLRQAAGAASNPAATTSTVNNPDTMDNVLRQGYIRPVLNLAQEKIAARELDDAERLLDLAPYFFIRDENEKVDLLWLKAELAAAKGNKTLAVKLGTAAREQFEIGRLNDLNVAGILVYGQDIYQLQTLTTYLVPQVTWMQYPGDWQKRMENLESWQE